MMGAADINGFILQACKIMPRSGAEASRPGTGAYGIIIQKEFATWVEFYLCPIIGNFQRNEPRSIIITDNASVHFSPRVRYLIEKAGGIYFSFPNFRPISTLLKKCSILINPIYVACSLKK